MYPVTQDFLDKMKADRRQVLARVAIDYTDPFMDQSLTIEANEQANVSYPQQTADSVDQTTRKYACLDGIWDLTSGEYHLAPSADQLTQQQFGWWGAQFADQDGYFAQPYPTLTVQHMPRPIRSLKVMGDSARGEYPVDFEIRLYGPDDTLLKTETVTGNDQVSWSKALEPQVLDVAKQELIITRWSRPGTCAKIIEFFTSIREVYETGDLVSVRLLEEREASQGSLPVGNISSNEITLALNNADKKFDLDNENSPLKNLLKPNRRIQAWLGAEAENAAAENPPTFTRNSVAYLSDGTQVAANMPRFEPGKFGKAIMVEEGTTNLLTANQSDVETGMSGFGLYGCTLSRDTSLSWHGSACLKVTANGGVAFGPYVTTANASVIAGENVTASAYVRKGQGDYSVRITIEWKNSSGQIIGYAGSVDTPLTEHWQRLTVTGTAPAGTDRVTITIYTGTPGVAGDYFYVDGWQVEKKAYPTSWVPGGTTRSPETLTIPTAGVLNPQEGTVECWVKVPIVTDWNNFFNMATSNGRFLLFFRADGSATFDYGVPNSGITTPGGTIVANNWYHIVLRWSESAGKQALFVNGVKYEQDLPNGIATSFPTTVYIVNNYSAYIDDLRISSRARTDEEILAAYQAGKPLQRDEDTTCLLTFNGSIYPVEMCWVPLGTFWSLDWDSPDDSLEATVTARDRMELLRKSTFQTSQVLQNKSLYELAEIVLQDAGLTSDQYIIDTALQNIIVPYAWFNPVSHREALRKIAEAGLAATFQNRDGKIQIESFLLSGDEPVLEITDDDYFPPLRTPSRQSQVANEIVVDTQPLRPALVPEEVYRSNEPLTIPAHATVAITVFYNSQPVMEATAALGNPPAGVSIVEATYYGWGASIKIANSTGTDQQVTLVITGRPLSVQNKERAVARDEVSILENGLLTYEFPANPLVQTLAQAQAIADALLASVKEPRRDIEVEWRGNPALELGDRVTVKGKDYHVIRQEISWQGYLSARLTGRRAT